MKRIINLMLCVIMLLSLVACGNDTSEAHEVSPTNPVQAAPIQGDTNDGNGVTDNTKFEDDIPDAVMQKAAQLSANINSTEFPNKDYWAECLQFLISEVDREDWDTVLKCMEWGTSCVNTFNVDDLSDHSHRYYEYSGGVFSLLHYKQWYTYFISYNITWEIDGCTHTATRTDANEPGYIMMEAPNHGIFLIELTSQLPTNITTLSQPTNDDYFVGGPWVTNMVDEFTLSKNHLFAQAEELFWQMEWDETMTYQQYWDAPMSFVVNNIDRSLWHEFFNQLEDLIPYSGHYGYSGVNIFNAFDSNSYAGGADRWEFNNGVFTLPADSYHYVRWSENITWDGSPDDYLSTRNARLTNQNEEGVIFLRFCDYYYYVVVISPDEPTRLTNLTEYFEDEFSVLFWNCDIIFPDELDEFFGEEFVDETSQ